MMYIWFGILLFIAGLILVTFIPFSKIIERIGSIFMVVGVIIAVLFPLISNWWKSSQMFQIVVYGIGIFIVILLVLFSGEKKKK